MNMPVHKTVILSGAGTSQSEVPAESKDPYTLHEWQGRAREFSPWRLPFGRVFVERLMHFLNALDRDVEIVIRKSLDRGEA
jgi:hypothetical protein